MSIHTKQSSKYAGKDWWSWSVWLDAPQQDLDTIDHVVYTLHATFPDPVQTIKTRRNGFKLTSAGWGGFNIYLKIRRKDGSVVKKTHQLILEYPVESTRQTSLRSRQRPKRLLKPEPKSGRVYISSGAADAEFTQQLKVALAKQGMENVSVDNASTSEPWEHAVKRAIASADATVFIVSGEPTLWTNVEMKMANTGGRKPLIPVLIGRNATLPGVLGDRLPLRIDAKGVGTAAKEIMRATKLESKSTANKK